MITDAAFAWRPEQLARLEQFGVTRIVDVHCHLLPGLDDGPASEIEAVQLAEALAADGITTVAATPHQLGRYDRQNSAAVIRESIAQLSSALETAGVPLEILPGGDVRIDERLSTLLDQGEVGTIGDRGLHLLLELPHELLIDPLPTIEALTEKRLQPILTHPERHRYLAGTRGLLEQWVEAGAVIQITAGSLLGDFGRRAYDQAWQLVDEGLAALVASDAHDTRRRPPRLAAATAKLAEHAGPDVARRLAIDHPLCVYEATPIPFRSHG